MNFTERRSRNGNSSLISLIVTDWLSGVLEMRRKHADTSDLQVYLLFYFILSINFILLVCLIYNSIMLLYEFI